MKTGRIQLAVMDMWRPLRNSLERNAPQARFVFDKFHIMHHVGNALDEVPRSEYRRLSGKDRTLIKGQRHTLLFRWENLSSDGRNSLKKLLSQMMVFLWAPLVNGRPSFSRHPSSAVW